MDISGLKVYGEGKWKVRMQGFSKHQTCRKLNLSVDESNHQIQAVVLTEAGQRLLGIGQLSGDDSNDEVKFYDTCHVRRGNSIAIPAHHIAKICHHSNCKKEPLTRDKNLRRICQLGRNLWEIEVGYHRRSSAETDVFRFKTIFGNSLRTRLLPRQLTDAHIEVVTLNHITHLGMPDSYSFDLR